MTNATITIKKYEYRDNWDKVTTKIGKGLRYKWLPMIIVVIYTCLLVGQLIGWGLDMSTYKWGALAAHGISGRVNISTARAIGQAWRGWTIILLTSLSGVSSMISMVLAARVDRKFIVWAEFELIAALISAGVSGLWINVIKHAVFVVFTTYQYFFWKNQNTAVEHRTRRLSFGYYPLVLIIIILVGFAAGYGISQVPQGSAFTDPEPWKDSFSTIIETFAILFRSLGIVEAYLLFIVSSTINLFIYLALGQLSSVANSIFYLGFDVVILVLWLEATFRPWDQVEDKYRHIERYHTHINSFNDPTLMDKRDRRGSLVNATLAFGMFVVFVLGYLTLIVYSGEISTFMASLGSWSGLKDITFKWIVLIAMYFSWLIFDFNRRYYKGELGIAKYARIGGWYVFGGIGNLIMNKPEKVKVVYENKGDIKFMNKYNKLVVNNDEFKNDNQNNYLSDKKDIILVNEKELDMIRIFKRLKLKKQRETLSEKEEKLLKDFDNLNKNIEIKKTTKKETTSEPKNKKVTAVITITNTSTKKPTKAKKAPTKKVVAKKSTTK